ncbi:MAG: AI-2E family transporter [Angelakisella sp.]
MEQRKKEIKVFSGYVALLIIFYWALQNLKLLGEVASGILGLLSPFLLGLVLAFMINVPMSQVERLLFSKVKQGKRRAFVRMLSLVITLALVVGLIFVVLFLVVPELARSITVLGNSIPGYLDQASKWAMQMSAEYPELFGSLSQLQLDWNSLLSTAMTFIQQGMSGLLSSTVGIAAGVFSGVFSFFLAVIFAIYTLLQKEKLHQQLIRVLQAFLPEQRCSRLLYISGLTNRAFTSFLSGQCLEAVILGTLFFVTLSILRFPYALLISVLTGFTALIPIFGAFIGCAVGAFLILMIQPMQAVWFIILFIVIQQLEGNLIYPKVVGGSIGLPSIWVLLAVTVGGSAMGIAGMLLFIPICSVLYTLLWEAVDRRKPVIPAQSKPEDKAEEVKS